MNLGQLVEKFRIDADDNAAPYLWSNADLTMFLNEAQEEACIRGKLIFEADSQSICEVAISGLATTYPLNPSIIEIVYVSLTDSSGSVYPIEIKDRIELDRISPNWRDTVERPKYIIHLDNSIRIGCIPDADYTIKLEVHRLPLVGLVDDTDIPEINAAHHIKLVQYALYRAYSKPDADALNLNKAQTAYDNFERYFGARPNAELRKDENANRPHANKVWL